MKEEIIDFADRTIKNYPKQSTADKRMKRTEPQEPVGQY